MPRKSKTQPQATLHDDEIATRAYFLFETEGRPAGRDVEHWLAAERQLLSERQSTPSGEAPRTMAQSLMADALL